MLRCLMLIFVNLVLLSAVETPAPVPASPEQADHMALRALRDELTSALNATDFPRLEKCLVPGFSLTFADQTRFTDLAALTQYNQQLRDQSGIIRMEFKPQEDGPAILITPDTAVATGLSTDSFVSVDGSSTSIISRWTATMVRRERVWKLAAFQSGVNLLDNPILDRQRQGLIRVVVLGAILTLIVGLLGGWLMGRRRS